MLEEDVACCGNGFSAVTGRVGEVNFYPVFLKVAPGGWVVYYPPARSGIQTELEAENKHF